MGFYNVAMKSVKMIAIRLWNAVWGSWRDGHRIAMGLFKFLIPIVIVVKILTELGCIEYLAMPLRPIMSMVGLPAELGLAWAASMLVNIYSGLLVFLSLAPTLGPLTVAQMTTFGLMILIAHSMILETRIAGQCGLSMPVQFFFRIFMAIIAGLVMYWGCLLTGTLESPAIIVLESGKVPVTWGEWAQNECYNLVKIYFLVWAVMLLQRGLEFFKVQDLLGKLLAPVLRLLGISPNAAAIILVGFSMGLIYGSGAIIKNVREGQLTARDAFCAMTLMGIAHSLIEDTLLLALLGASLWGLLLVRLVLALIAGVVINHVYNRFQPETISETASETTRAAS